MAPAQPRERLCAARAPHARRSGAQPHYTPCIWEYEVIFLVYRNTSFVSAGLWVSNPEAFFAAEKKKKPYQKTNQPPNTQSYVGSCCTDLPVKIPLLQPFLSASLGLCHHSHPTPVALPQGTSHRDISPPHPWAAGVRGNKPPASSSASKRNKGPGVIGDHECHPPGSPPPATRSPCHKLSASCLPRAAGRWGGKRGFCAKIKGVLAWGVLEEKHGGAAKRDPQGNTHRALPHAGHHRCHAGMAHCSLPRC